MWNLYFLLLLIAISCSLTSAFISASDVVISQSVHIDSSPKLRSRTRLRNYQSSHNNLEDEEAAYTLVFVRHGQSTWNKANRFIGWTDTELTEEGILEARIAGQLLASDGFTFDEVHTSMLKRAIKTTWLVLEQLGHEYTPVTSDWRLNERSYGALVGLYKKECVEEFGPVQVKKWRRSYDIPPPPMDEYSEFYPGNDPRYQHIPREWIPLSESLKDTSKRSLWYWNEVITPKIRQGKRILISGHENNLRSLLMNLDNIPPEVIVNVELPRAIPLVYKLDANLKPIKMPGSAPHLSGRYLGDPTQIAAIMDRDSKQVYDLSVKENLETEEAAFDRLRMVEGQTQMPPSMQPAPEKKQVVDTHQGLDPSIFIINDPDASIKPTTHNSVIENVAAERTSE